jgi:diguanylate cyclase (GGDEF)-like protein
MKPVMPDSNMDLSAAQEGRHRSTTVPLRALALSVIALTIPVLATTLLPGWLERDGALLVWLPALLPAFLLTYYRGRWGASLALAAGMAVLTLTQVAVVVLDLGPPRWSSLFAVVVILLSVCLGAGWLAGLLHQERARAERWALSDVLTGLPNRRYLEMFLDKTWAAARRGRKLSLVFLDIDHFKQVNNDHGHAEGDRVLKSLGQVLSERTRRMDLSGRFGGEEFVAVLVDCDLDDAEAFAEFVRQRFSEIDFGWGHVTSSAGVAALEEGMDSPDALIAAADRALYAAKEQGRNRVCRAPATTSYASRYTIPDPSIPQQRPQFRKPVAHDEVPLGLVGVLRCQFGIRSHGHDEALAVRVEIPVLDSVQESGENHLGLTDDDGRFGSHTHAEERVGGRTKRPTHVVKRAPVRRPARGVVNILRAHLP